ncbi:hypothetical protein A9Q87_00240 [Flavobacteriales bacterium 34_180_T64]|nr:hypothetical protein A9Q87_00240 [Flavobacteriales bacterium 34_180_T64]
MISEGTYTVQEIQAEAEAHFSIVGTDKGKGYKPYKRWEYQALRNMDESGMLKSSEFYFNELENYNSSLNENFMAARTTVGTWSQLGPIGWDLTGGWNPGVGRLTSMAFETGNTDHMIVGGNTGGVWKSLDGGSTWAVLTDNMATLNVSSLVIDPTNPSIYFWGSSGGAIFKSTDAGATWNFYSDMGSGDVNKILMDPTNTSKMYCSSANGGIKKSIDGGLNWTLIDGSANSGYDIEFKPGDPSTIYASGDKFFKSTDGGLTFSSPNGLSMWTQEFVTGSNYWTTSNSNQNNSVTPRTGSAMAVFYVGNFSQPVTRLISPSIDLSGANAPELKFSYSQVSWASDIDELKVLYKTSAAGAWVELANYTTEVTSWSDITLSLPNPSSDYYIALEGKANYGRGLTIDDVSVEDASLGVLFQDGFESAPNNFSSGPKMMGVSANDPNVVYVIEASGGIFGGLHKSIDGGNTFSQLDHTGMNYFGYASDGSDDSGQAPRDMDIVVNPNDINEVHIAGVNTWRSTDGGVNFSITSQWTPQNASGQNIGYCHADVDMLEYVDGKLYVCSDGGVFVANTPGTIDANYYTDLTSGIGVHQFYKFGISQTDPVIITGGSQDNGTTIMDVNGNWGHWLGADGMESFVDKNNSDLVFGTIYFGDLYRSYNGGLNSGWLGTPDDKDGGWVTPYEQDPLTPNVIYAGFDQVYKSFDSGTSWTAISQNFGGNLDELKVAPSNANYIYASNGNSLYRTTNGGLIGSPWQQLTGFSGSINSIAIHPTNPNKIAIATNSAAKVYVSDNGGTTWSSYLFDLPNFSARALVWQDNGLDGLYLGMNYGVYYIDTVTPSNWQAFSNNLPNAQISELEINTANNKIYVATYGRGVWSSDLYDTALSVDEFELNSLSLFPNPTKNEFNLVWDRNDEVSIRIFNSLGKIMYFTKDQILSEPLNIDVSHYASGIYFVKVNNSVGEVTKKLIVD